MIGTYYVCITYLNMNDILILHKKYRHRKALTQDNTIKNLLGLTGGLPPNLSPTWS